MQQQFKNFIKNKRVIFVCPSKLLEGKGLGKWIDGFDVVIRTNNAFPTTKEHEKDFGVKCDILYVNNQYTKECSPFPVQQWKELGLQWICFKCGINRLELYSPYVKLRSITHIYNQIKDKVHSALMGTMVVQDIINCKPKDFMITGMTFYNGKILDWENQYMSGYLPPKILIPAKKKRDAGYFTKSKVHDTESNKKFVLSLYNQGYLRFDDHTSLVLGLRKKSKFEKNDNTGVETQVKENEIMEEVLEEKKLDPRVNPATGLLYRKISIRNAKTAKSGLQDMCNYLKNNVFKGRDDLTILEIGAFAGDSTEIFAKNFKRVISVDPWKSNYSKADQASDPNIFNMVNVMAQFDEVMNFYGNIEKMRMSSLEASKLFENESIDLVYVDGNHEYLYVKQDIEIWLPKVKGQNIILGHDYQQKFVQTIKAVDEVLKPKGQIVKFLDTSWVWIKNK